MALKKRHCPDGACVCSKDGCHYICSSHELKHIDATFACFPNWHNTNKTNQCKEWGKVEHGIGRVSVVYSQLILPYCELCTVCKMLQSDARLWSVSGVQ